MSKASAPPPPPAPAKANDGLIPAAPHQKRRPVAKMLVTGTEGVGKSTLAAQMDSPLILMAPNETGYEDLLAVGRVPAVRARVVDSWSTLLKILDALIADDQGVRTVVLDAVDGFEALLVDHVVRTRFGGDWNKFDAYGRGWNPAATEWRGMLQRLERFSTAHGANVALLCHARVARFNNPEGEDFDRYEATLNKHLRAETYGWCNAALFFNFYTAVQKDADGRRAKGKGGHQRVCYTERRAAFDAKNRFGMPPEIDLPDDHTRMWPTIRDAMLGQEDSQ